MAEGLDAGDEVTSLLDELDRGVSDREMVSGEDAGEVEGDGGKLEEASVREGGNELKDMASMLAGL